MSTTHLEATIPESPKIPLSEQLTLAERQSQMNMIGRRFSHGTKPVIRWIKGNGLDDAVTKAAIGQATRLFGASVDYCLCTNYIDAARVRDILEWSTQPVEWWPVSESDNPQLAKVLTEADCSPEYFGYWWKWFPERVRPDAPEWILDGDMVITATPSWFDLWHSGKDGIRITQDDLWPATGMYGKYVSHVNLDLKLYSGLISLPPKATYMNEFLKIIQKQPLAIPHDGRKDMCEQGVVAAAFQQFEVQPIPLYEFPFGRAFEDHIDYGLQGNQNKVWGYHFGNSFILDNPHFHRLTKAGIVYSKPKGKLLRQLRYLFNTSGERIRKLSERYQWLGNIGQWGIPGWAISDEIAIIICKEVEAYAGKKVLELGTSRGHLSVMLASLGCQLTTVDHEERGAAQNLAGLNVTVIVEDAIKYLMSTDDIFDLIVVDVHGNTPKDWARLKEPLLARLRPGGKLVIDNVALYEIAEWKEETGVQWFLDQLPKSWQIKINSTVTPGVATVIKGGS